MVFQMTKLDERSSGLANQIFSRLSRPCLRCTRKQTIAFFQLAQKDYYRRAHEEDRRDTDPSKVSCTELRGNPGLTLHPQYASVAWNQEFYPFFLTYQEDNFLFNSFVN